MYNTVKIAVHCPDGLCMSGSDLPDSTSTAWPLCVHHDTLFVIKIMSKHSSNIFRMCFLWLQWLHSLSYSYNAAFIFEANLLLSLRLQG